MSHSQPMRVVSGIQPTGDLHLGNLLGAILRWVRMQDEAECLFFLADLHALTVDVDPAAAARQRPRDGGGADRQRHRSRQVDPVRPERGPRPCRAGLDPAMHRAHGLAQPHDPVQGQGGQERAKALSVGLFAYPVLQAADVLLYQATHVPVGEDQKQHIELARDIAIKFNTDFDVELFIAARAVHRRRHRGAGDEPARRNGENVQVRPVGHEPDQPDRQRRRDRAEDPQGEDRPRAAARRSGAARRRGRKRRTSSASTRRSPARASSRCSRASPARASARSSRRWPMRSIALLAPLRDAADGAAQRSGRARRDPRRRRRAGRELGRADPWPKPIARSA